MLKDNVYLFNYWWNKNNYGAILTAYALQQVLNQRQINSFLVEDINKTIKNYELIYNFSKKFKKQYFKIKEIKKSLQYELNLDCNVFITGSDQVFRAGTLGSNDRYSQYFLDFANINAKKIAFSASFGLDKEAFLKETDTKTVEKVKNSLRSFDFISVREKSGLEICKDLFNVDAKWIIDPVFMLDKSMYEGLIENSTVNYNNKIVSYVLDNNNDYKKAYKFLSKKYNSNHIEIADSNISIENWLASIKNCKLFITDSFHGMCFAIIFNKPFICMANKRRGRTRFDSILEMLEIDNQCIDSINKVFEKDCVFKIDYEKVNNVIQKQVEIALGFLETALNAPICVTEEKFQSRLNYLERRIKEIEEENKLSYKYKIFMWNAWLVIFYNLPKFMQKIIRKFKNRGKNG